MKDRVERQVLFLINNLTKMTVSVSFPDLSQLGEGRSSLSYENLKKILKDENAKDIANGNTKPLALSGA